MHSINIKEICENKSVKYGTVRMRIKRGWSIEEAIEIPVQQKQKYVNIKSEQLSIDGYLAMFKEYKNSNDCTIVFEDGFEKHITIYRWNSGEFTKYSHRDGKTPQHSLNECAAYYYFSQIGFCKTNFSELKQFGFRNGSNLDLFHPNLLIAIEYDGMGHFYEKDHEKNIICKNNNIVIYRLREKNCEIFDDGISINFSELPTSWLSKRYEESLILLMKIICQKYQITPIDIDFKRDRKKIFDIYAEYHIKKPTKREKERAEIKRKNKEKRLERNNEIKNFIIDHPQISYSEIGRIFHVSDQTVYRIARNFEISRYNSK